LAAAAKSLEAMLQAHDSVRPPVERFYNSLDDEQKAQLVVLIANASQGDGSAERGGLGRICQEPASLAPVGPVGRLREGLRPTGGQVGGTGQFCAAASQATGVLEARSPTEKPLTPPARLEAMRKRLDALLQAVRTLQPAVAGLYDVLDQRQ